MSSNVETILTELRDLVLDLSRQVEDLRRKNDVTQLLVTTLEEEMDELRRQANLDVEVETDDWDL